jgi:hypothetical protein
MAERRCCNIATVAVAANCSRSSITACATALKQAKAVA